MRIALLALSMACTGEDPQLPPVPTTPEPSTPVPDPAEWSLRPVQGAFQSLLGDSVGWDGDALVDLGTGARTETPAHTTFITAYDVEVGRPVVVDDRSAVLGWGADVLWIARAADQTVESFAAEAPAVTLHYWWATVEGGDLVVSLTDGSVTRLAPTDVLAGVEWSGHRALVIRETEAVILDLTDGSTVHTLAPADEGVIGDGLAVLVRGTDLVGVDLDDGSESVIAADAWGARIDPLGGFVFGRYSGAAFLPDGTPLEAGGVDGPQIVPGLAKQEDADGNTVIVGVRGGVLATGLPDGTWREIRGTSARSVDHGDQSTVVTPWASAVFDHDLPQGAYAPTGELLVWGSTGGGMLALDPSGGVTEVVASDHWLCPFTRVGAPGQGWASHGLWEDGGTVWWAGVDGVAEEVGVAGLPNCGAAMVGGSGVLATAEVVGGLGTVTLRTSSGVTELAQGVDRILDTGATRFARTAEGQFGDDGELVSLFGGKAMGPVHALADSTALSDRFVAVLSGCTGDPCAGVVRIWDDQRAEWSEMIVEGIDTLTAVGQDSLRVQGAAGVWLVEPL